MRNVLFAILISTFSIAGCKNEESFKAKVISIIPKNDGAGYAIVLRAAYDPNDWLAAVVTDYIAPDDTVTVDRAKGKIYFQNNKEGLIINKQDNSGYILPK